jgi:hypothetical protein
LKFAKNHASLGVITLALALTACGKSEETTAPGAAPSATQAAPSPAAPPAAPPKGADGNTLRLQGTIQVNAGEGEQALQSYATVVDPKLGEKAAARLGTAQGQKALADGNASIGAKSGVSVSSSDVQDMANAMAGRTVYTSQANHIEIINSYGITLDAKSPAKPGVRVQLSLRFSDKDMKLTDGKLEFYPDSGKYAESYQKKITPAEVTIDKLERKDEKTFVISGSFKVADLKAGVLAKELKGKTLDSVSGRFDFQEIPIRGK